MQLSSVVLPAPFGPMMPRTSPSSTPKLTPARAFTPPKRLLTSLTASKVMPAPTLTLPRKRGREVSHLILPCERGRGRTKAGKELPRRPHAGPPQWPAEIPQRQPAPTAEEVDHAARDEDDAGGQ